MAIRNCMQNKSKRKKELHIPDVSESFIDPKRLTANYLMANCYDVSASHVHNAQVKVKM